VLSRRARYFTFFPFLLQTFRELQLPASNDVPVLCLAVPKTAPSLGVLE
jgi:hypothetical protein